MKKLKTVSVVTAFTVVSVSIVLATIQLSSRYLASTKASASCTGQNANHRAVIEHERINPSHIKAKLCDTLTIVNNDAKSRLIAFGQHDRHVSYDGVSETALKRGEQVTITLNKAGTYLFHDHMDDTVAGNFTVAP